MISYKDVDAKDVCHSFNEQFDISYLNCDLDKRLALIACTCYLTNELNKKRSNYDKLSCYDVLSQIAKKNHPDLIPDFIKSLAAICQSMMEGSKKFPDFGVPIKEMPKFIDSVLNTYIPF